MFLFLRIILAHFLADFPFQPNIIYKLKLKGFRGQFLHAAIFAACSIALCWPFLEIKAVWILILLLGISHLVIDCLKVGYFNAEKHRVGAFLADQVSHIAAIGVIFLTGLKKLSFSSETSFMAGRLYANNVLILLLIICLIASFVIRRVIILYRSS